MEHSQVARIEELAKRLQLGQGEVMRIAHELVGEEVASLYNLDRAELTRIVCHLDALQLAGVA